MSAGHLVRKVFGTVFGMLIGLVTIVLGLVGLIWLTYVTQGTGSFGYPALDLAAGATVFGAVGFVLVRWWRSHGV